MILKQTVRKDGYHAISFCYKRKHVNYLIHRLVASHFVKNPESKPQVNHKDGDKSNNFANNLEWCTPSENMLHSYSTGLQASRQGITKLPPDVVELIKNNYIPWDKNFGLRALASRFGLSTKTISRYISGVR